MIGLPLTPQITVMRFENNCELYGTSDLQEWYQRCVIEPTLASLEEFQERDSGWALTRILNLTANVNKYNPLRTGCHHKLPRKLSLKKATISVQSPDNACFAWAVVAALHPAEIHVDRSSSYPNYASVLNLQGIEIPMSLEQLGKFERQNGISVNEYTFGMEKGSTVFPLRLTSQKRDRHVNLLYTPNHEHGDVGHFLLIKDLSRLVGAQLSRHKEKKFICDRCMHYFGSVEKLEAHSLDCRQMNDCAILLPSEGNNLLKFSNHCMKERLPFVVYADLECIIEKTEDNHRMGEIDSKLRAYQHHKVHSIAYYMHCLYDTSLLTYRCRRDADCVSWFVNDLENFANFAKPILTERKHKITEDVTRFNDGKMTNVKLFLNSALYPYDDLNLDFDKNKHAILYHMYTQFHKSNYGHGSNDALLTVDELLQIGPLVRVSFRNPQPLLPRFGHVHQPPPIATTILKVERRWPRGSHKDVEGSAKDQPPTKLGEHHRLD
ncbi:uncharacterized protein LOC143370803 [Andrena cerasifolii]|uniref:uncharacterized protein LOC143370803 n=1 Tax=Andrena cerasifolii TaxID=2819439 RepID=UPI004037B0EA